MNSKLSSALTLSLTLLTSVGANAYVLDPTTKVVTDADSGKQWLQWTETAGRSINDDFSSLSGGGWSVATNQDMAALYGDFFNTVAWDANENTLQDSQSSNTHGDGLDKSYEFGELFGWTVYEDSVSVLSGQTASNYDNYNLSLALFGDDLDGDGKINRAFVMSEYVNNVDKAYFVPELARLTNDDWSATIASPSHGVALVRDIPITSVPEPSAFALFGLGLLGLTATRRKVSL